MTKTCRAAVFLGDHTYEMREFAVPDPPPGGAVLQVEAVGLWGGYGEYMEIFPGTELLRMSSDGPAEHLTLFEPLASAVNWVDIVGVRAKETVVVQGPGHQGLAVLEAVLAKQPRQVIVTGTSDDRLRLDAAMEIGASNVVMVDAEDAHTIVYDLTRGMGADVVFDVATATATVPMAVDLARSGGRILLAGLKHYAEVPGFVTDHIVLKSLQLFGGAGFTPDSMARAVALIESGDVRTDVVAGEVFDLDHIDDAMALLTRSVPGRDAVRVGLKHSH